MDKISYFMRSQELGLPPRCPLVGYCARWAWSIYFNTYHSEKFKDKETVFEFLKRKGELPSDFDAKKIELCGEPIESHKSTDGVYGQRFCPEISLFSDHRPLVLPKEAISSFSWFKHEELRIIEHTHFSECLEFIQTRHCQQAETDPLETAKKELIAFRNEVERQAWKDIFVQGKPQQKGKPQENIARALLQIFLKNRSYREVPVRGGKTDILSFQKGGRLLYETKIWRGEEYHKQGLREIEEYIKGEEDELLAVFYVVFDPTKSNRSKSFLKDDFTIERAGKYDIYTITICLAPPQPSAIKSPENSTEG